jgi:hypothetical protein
LVRAALQEHGADAPTGRSAREVLAAHLDAFHRFALAAAARGGFDLAFERPWKTSLPLDLPDTPWSLTGEMPVATLLGFESGSLVIDHAGLRTRLPCVADAAAGHGGLVMQTCPVIDHEGCRIHLKPDAFTSRSSPVRPRRCGRDWSFTAGTQGSSARPYGRSTGTTRSRSPTCATTSQSSA